MTGAAESTCTAAVLLGVERVELRELPLPAVGDDAGLLRVEATGVCGSDVHAYFDGYDLYPPPCILGHELAGTVEAIGARLAERTGVRAGDRVVVEEYLPCGLCPACLAGCYQMCPVPRYGGRSIDSAPGLWGGYAERLHLDARALLHPIGDLPAVLAQLYVPISNGLHWVGEVGGMAAGDTVAVLGPGAHGLGCVVAAREAGAGRVILLGTGRDARRLAVGRALGADATVDVDADDATGAVAELTAGRGADVVVNAASAGRALADAVRIAADRATVVHVGVASGNVPLPADLLIEKMLAIKGVRGRPSRCVRPALELIASRRYPLELVSTHVFPLAQTEAALRAVREQDDVIRAVVAVHPDGPA